MHTGAKGIVAATFPQTDRRWWALLLLGAALIGMTVGAYLPVLNGGFIWDDGPYVTDLAALRTAGGLRDIWFDLSATPQYYPLTFTSFWGEYRLWGLKPFGYRAVNVAAHAGTVVLLWLALRRLGIRGAWLAAALFGLHPVNVESVALVCERKNVLSGLLALGAMLSYLRFQPAEIESARSPARWGWYGLAIVLFAMAMLSKTIVCSLPLVILLVVWWKRGRLGPADLWLVLPLLVIGAGLGLLTAWIEASRYVPAETFRHMGPADRLVVAGRALWFYAWKLFWPAELIPVYPRWTAGAAGLAGWAFAAAAGAAATGLWLSRRRIGRGPVVAVLVFGGTLAPALGLLPVAYHRKYSFVADHFLYLSGASLAALVIAVVAEVARRLKTAGRMTGLAIGLTVLALAGWRTSRQGRIYRDELSLWRDTVARNPDSGIARVNLGAELGSRGLLAEALVVLDRAIELDNSLMLAHYNRALVRTKYGEHDSARRDLTRAIELDPGYEGSYLSRGHLFLQAGRHELAIADFSRAIQLKPRYPRAYSARGLAHALRGQFDLAVCDLDQAIRLDPRMVEAYLNRGMAFNHTGQFARAVEDFTAAIELDPRSSAARANRAAANFNRGNYETAWADVRACRALGGQVSPELLEGLRRATGRQD